MVSEALALKRFEVSRDGNADGTYLLIHCRRRGLRAAIRTMLGLDLNVSMEVKKDSIAFKDLSLFAETYHTIPITAVRGVVAGIRRPIWKLIWATFFLLLGIASFVAAGQQGLLTEYTAGSRESELATFIIGGVVAMLMAVTLIALHARQKRLFIEFEYGASRPKGLLLQRSWKVLVHVPAVREAVALVNDLVVASSTKETTVEAIVQLASEPATTVAGRQMETSTDGPVVRPLSKSS